MRRFIALIGGCLVIAGSAQSYPIDGYEHSGIRRVVALKVQFV